MQNDYNPNSFDDEQNITTEQEKEIIDAVSSAVEENSAAETGAAEAKAEETVETDASEVKSTEPDPQPEPEPTYSYSEERQEIPRWTPYEEPRSSVSKPEKPKKRWVIPLVVVLAIMVIAIVVGVVIGARQLGHMVNSSVKDAQTEIQEAQEPETKDAVKEPETSSTISPAETGTYVLTDVSSIVDELMPSVVSITSRALVDTGLGDYWNFFFGGGSSSRPGTEKEEVDAAYGSGTIISQNDKELLILTSYHVVEDSSSLYVTFYDGSAVDGYIKSQSEADDIAIVAVPLSDISKATIDGIAFAKLSAEPAKVGEGAIVIGNALGYGMSVTSGIVSATDRVINVEGRTLTVLQTDAAINSGNSGGCMLNSKGEIIGISEAKIIVSNVEGMCYAIQVSSNTDLIQDLLNDNSNAEKKEAEANAKGAYLGIRGRDIDQSLAASYGMPQGVYVASTVPGSGAEKAKLQEGDIIVGMDNVSFSTMAELQEQLSRHNPGDKVNLILMREVNGKYTQMKVEVELTDIIS